MILARHEVASQIVHNSSVCSGRASFERCRLARAQLLAIASTESTQSLSASAPNDGCSDLAIVPTLTVPELAARAFAEIRSDQPSRSADAVAHAIRGERAGRVRAEHDCVQRLELLPIGFLGGRRRKRAIDRVATLGPYPPSGPLLAVLTACDCSDLLTSDPLPDRPEPAHLGTITTSEQLPLFRGRSNAGYGRPRAPYGSRRHRATNPRRGPSRPRCWADRRLFRHRDCFRPHRESTGRGSDPAIRGRKNPLPSADGSEADDSGS